MFIGTPGFAIPTLDAIAASGHHLAAIYTMPPRPAGRGRIETRSPVHQHALDKGLLVVTPSRIADVAAHSELAALAPDLVVVAAYGAILPLSLLEIPRLGCINVHASLLPRWRGAAPVQRAILAGDRTTGITLIQMDRGMDTGDIIDMRSLEIGHQTAGEITEALSHLGGIMIADMLGSMDRVSRSRQTNEGSTRAAKITTEEARIDFTKEAVQVARQVRAFNPWPGAWTRLGTTRIRIHSAQIVSGPIGTPAITVDDRMTIACGTEAIRPLIVQREGRRPVDIEQLLQSMRIPAGTTIG